MADEKVVEDGDVIDSDAEGKVEIPVKEKSFSQEEVNEIVRKRLAAEKRTHDVALAQTTDRASKLEAYLGETLSAQLAGVPENIKKLLDKLSVEDKIEWLKDPANQVSIPLTPQTPKGVTRTPEFFSNEKRKI